MTPPYGPYNGIVRDIHDGDTMGIDLDLGFDQFILAWNPITGERAFTCRLYGINAPELSTAAGKAALKFIKTLVKPGDPVSCLSWSWDKYGGRWDGEVILPDGRNINYVMLNSGHAKPMPA
jgi:endonuclease YncB( thermonuclease family)